MYGLRKEWNYRPADRTMQDFMCQHAMKDIQDLQENEVFNFMKNLFRESYRATFTSNNTKMQYRDEPQPQTKENEQKGTKLV